MKTKKIIIQGLKLSKFLFSYFTKRNICNYSPIIVGIEPTNRCNIKCIMCFRDHLSRKQGLLSVDLHNRFLDNNIQIKRIVYGGSGEPLMHPDLEKMIAYAGRKGVVTEVNTNAILMDKQRAENIILSNLDDIIFSFEGISEAEYQKVRIGSAYKSIEENIRNFIEIKKKLNNQKLSVNVDCVDLSYTFSEKKMFKNRMLAWGINNVNFLPLHNWPTSSINAPKFDNKKYYPCILPWIMINVLWNGDVVGCCDDFDGKNVIGNINSNISINEIFNSKAMCSLRNKLLKQDLSDVICGSCHRISKNPWKYPFLNRMKREVREVFIK